MDAEEFRKRGKEMVDYVADYLENIRDRRPLSNVKPGYLRELIPDEAPRDPEPWDDVFQDIERVIMPGVSIPTLTFMIIEKVFVPNSGLCFRPCGFPLPMLSSWCHSAKLHG